MAIRTQIRLPQITGSFGDAEGKIVDNLPVAATLAAIPAGSGSMVSAMSQLASSIQRIHGGTAFTTNAAGVFSHDIKFDANASLDFGDSSNNAAEVHTRAINSNDTLVIDSAGAMTIDTDGAGVDINIGIEAAAKTITVGNDASTQVDVNALAIELDAVNTVLLDGGKNASDAVKLNASNAAGGVQIYGGSGGFDLDVTSAGAGSGNGAVDIAAGLAMNISAVNDMTLTTSATNKKIKLQSQFSGTGTGMQFQADSSAGSKMHFLAGVVDMDVTGAATIDAGGAAHLKSTGGVVTLSGSNGATSVNVTSPATFADNVVITGNLDVNGTTTTIDSTNTTVEDRIIGLGISGSNGDISNLETGIIFSFGTAGVDKQSALQYNGSRYKLAKGAHSPASGAFEAPSANSDWETLQLGKVEFSGTDDTLFIDGGTLTLTGDSGLELVSNTTTDIVLDAGGAVVIDGSGTLLEFGSADSGESISGNGTDLTVASGAKINLTATSDVVIPSGVGLILDGSGDEKIESDGTDISFSVGTGGDINIPADIGLTFGNDGEKIEGDGTDLTITGGDINLTAEGDINIPANVGLTFGNDGEKIEGDGTDLTVSGNIINLNADANVAVTAGFLSLGDAASGPGELRFLEDTDDGSNYAALKAPNVTTSYTLLLPQAVGSANEVLRLADDSGTLEFADLSSQAIKSVQVATGSLVAGQLMTGVVANKVDFSRPTDANAPNIIDVYVNGQLLSSCSSTAFSAIGAATTDGDYCISGTESQGDVKFSFDIEIDDTITVMVR